MSSARWTSADLKRFQGRKLEAKIKRQPKPKAADKTALLFTRLCEVSGLPAPVSEYRFHPARKWRIDYYFEANGRRVALEVEGGVWTGGRHTTRPAWLLTRAFSEFSSSSVWWKKKNRLRYDQPGSA